MRFSLGKTDINTVVKERIGPGKLMLLRYGEGSGGEFLLKQFLGERMEGEYSIIISSYETEDEVRYALKSNDINIDGEIISFVPDREAELDLKIRRDEFLTGGVLVTDLYDLNELEVLGRAPEGASERFLSRINSTASKQTVPFKMVIDSLADLVLLSSKEEVRDRLRLLRQSLREMNGIAMVGAPIGNHETDISDLTVFDAIFEIQADLVDGKWRRTLTLLHNRNDPDLPEVWELETINPIPSAISLE